MRWENQRINLLFSLIISLLILISSLSLWFYRQVYNQEQFRNHVNTALQTEESKNALASLIIDSALKNRPILRNLIQDQAGQALAGALDSPRIKNIENKLIVNIHDVLFFDKKAIVIDLSGIKNFLKNLSYLVDSITDSQRKEIAIPDSIVILQKGDIPPVASLGVALLWIGPITFLIALVLIIWRVWKTNEKKGFLSILGACIALTSLFTILITAWYEPIILGLLNIRDSNARIVAEQILQEFLQALNHQNGVLFFIGVILTLGVAIYHYEFEKPKL